MFCPCMYFACLNFDIGFGPSFSPNTSIWPLRVKSMKSLQSNRVPENGKQSAADGVEPVGQNKRCFSFPISVPGMFRLCFHFNLK